MTASLASIGAAALGFLAAAGRLVLFAGRALAALFTPPYYPRLILRQFVEIGYFSLPVDALTSLFTDPLRYLVLPRLLAGLSTLPLLVIVADIIGVFGGFIVGVYKLDFNAVSFLTQTAQYLKTSDVVSGLVKAAVFGFIVALMGCYQGYYSRGGAEGVGQATTYAVVSSSILILLSDYFLTQA